MAVRDVATGQIEKRIDEIYRQAEEAKDHLKSELERVMEEKVRRPEV